MSTTPVYIARAKLIDQTCANMASQDHPWHIEMVTLNPTEADRWVNEPQGHSYRTVEIVDLANTAVGIPTERRIDREWPRHEQPAPVLEADSPWRTA